ncbi:MAG TPA: DUF5990 family protein [Thermoanaerobaculia bacterium]|jgi:hypothetical protein|nr:DUF5990 family protein [Thermoanaerobaculia bacterium]
MEINLRITVIDPPPGVAFKMQKGRVELVPPTHADAHSISFDFSVRVDDDANGNLRFLGPFTQGPPSVRFVYVNSGQRAGEGHSIWDRRAKVPLTGLTRALIDKASRDAGSVIEATIPGKSRDGGPVCASVALTSGWRVVKRRT